MTRKTFSDKVKETLKLIVATLTGGLIFPAGTADEIKMNWMFEKHLNDIKRHLMVSKYLDDEERRILKEMGYKEND